MPAAAARVPFPPLDQQQQTAARTYQFSPPRLSESYANEVVVTLRDHDAVLVFKRDGKDVYRVTVPRSLGEEMAKRLTKKGK